MAAADTPLPSGVTVVGGADDFRIRAGIRSVSGVAWSGGSLALWGGWGGWLVWDNLSSPTSSQVAPWASLTFGVVLLGLGAVFFGLLLFFALGRTEVRVIGDRGRVATGLWLWRSARRFSWGQVSQVREEGRAIVLRNAGRSFGGLLPDERRQAVATALARFLDERGGS